MILYKEADALPVCFCPEGCPIEDLATDSELDRKIAKYLAAKELYKLTEDPLTQRKAFRELGLYEDSKTHLELERIYSKWHSNLQSQATARARRR